LHLDTQEILDSIVYSEDKTKGIITSLVQLSEVFPKLYYIDFETMRLLGSFVIDIQTSNNPNHLMQRTRQSGTFT
jgi:hypothetical protein